MKKNYVNVECEIIFLTPKDVITMSGERIVHDPNNILNDEDNLDIWEW